LQTAILPADGRPRFKAGNDRGISARPAPISAHRPQNRFAGISSPKSIFPAAISSASAPRRQSQNRAHGKQIVKGRRTRAVSRLSPAMQHSGLKQLAASALS